MAEEDKKQAAEAQEDPLAGLVEEEEETASASGEPSTEEAESSQAQGSRAQEEESPPAEEEGGPEEEAPKEETTQAEGQDEKFEEDPLASILDEEEGEVEEEPEEEEKEEAEEAEEEETGPQAGEGGRFRILGFVLAAVFLLILAGAGIFTFYHLYRNPLVPSAAQAETPVTPAGEKVDEKGPEEAPLVTAPIAVEDRKILFLKDFLIPYRRETGEFVFVKAKVLLYFANSKEWEKAKRNEKLYREEIYRLFKNAPLYVWESKQGTKVIQREVKEYLTKKMIGGVVPVDLEVTGYILK